MLSTERSRALRTSRVTAVTMTLATLVALACPSGRVAPPGPTHVAEGRRFALVESERGSVRLVVTGRRWAVPPQKVLLHHSPLWVELVNRGERPLRFRPEDFVLEVGGERIPAEHPEALVRRGDVGSLNETRLLRTQGIRPRTLAPGETARGFLFFRHRFSPEEGAVHLRLELFDEAHEQTLDWLEVELEITQ